MVTEKLLAFGQAYVEMAMVLAQLTAGKLPSAKKLLQVQRKSLRPVKTTLAANTRRVKKKTR